MMLVYVFDGIIEIFEEFLSIPAYIVLTVEHIAHIAQIVHIAVFLSERIILDHNHQDSYG
jgi:hypothetical protein